MLQDAFAEKNSTNSIVGTCIAQTLGNWFTLMDPLLSE